MFRGLETVVYYVEDLKGARDWYSSVLGLQPNHDSDYYVGFTVAGCELGLHPVGDGPRRPGTHEQTAYWSVADVDAALAHLVQHGATRDHEVQDVGGGIKIASVVDPFGNVFGIIQNPNSPNR